MIELKLPELGEGIETAEVSRLLVAEGDAIAADQSVMELDSDKASFPLPSPHAGRVGKIRVKEGDTVSIGQTLMDIEEGDSSAAKEEEKKPAPQKKAPTAQAKEPEKAAPEEQKKDVPPEPKQKKAAPKDAKEAPPEKPQKERGDDDHVPAGPATRRLARELGVDLAHVHRAIGGTRVTREEVKAFVKNRMKQSPERDSAPPLPDFSRFGPIERRRLNSIARATAEHMSRAWHTIPHVTQHDLADITELEAHRKRLNEQAGESQAKITMTALALKAAVVALKVHPQFNSSIDVESGELIIKNFWNIGVAVDTEHGLLVPVVRDVDQKTVRTLAAELGDLAEKARKRTLTPRDMEGATFTISNLGGIGGGYFTPIVNYPEVAILGIGRARWQPVPRDGAFVSRLLLPLSLSYDHRAINGADGARFITKIAELLSDLFTFFVDA